MAIERAEKMAPIIMNLVPEDGSVYVLSDNIYAQSSNMRKRNQLTELMNNNGIKKISAISLVELNDKLQWFAIETNSNPQINEIQEKLQV